MCTNRESIGGGLRESPELRRDMACGGDGVLATPRWPSGVAGARVSHGVPRRWRSRDPAGWTVFGIPSGWTVFESPSTPWVPSCRPIGHVRPRSRVSSSSSSVRLGLRRVLQPAPRSASASHAARVPRQIGAPPAAGPAPCCRWPCPLSGADHLCLAWSLRGQCPASCY